MSIRLESRSLLQQDLFKKKKKGSAERLAKVNSEGEQLAAGGGESPFWDGVSGSCWP